MKINDQPLAWDVIIFDITQLEKESLLDYLQRKDIRYVKHRGKNSYTVHQTNSDQLDFLTSWMRKNSIQHTIQYAIPSSDRPSRTTNSKENPQDVILTKNT